MRIKQGRSRRSTLCHHRDDTKPIRRRVTSTRCSAQNHEGHGVDGTCCQYKLTDINGVMPLRMRLSCRRHRNTHHDLHTIMSYEYCRVIYSLVTSQMAERIVEVIVQDEAAKKLVVEQSINLVSSTLDESVVSHASITICLETELQPIPQLLVRVHNY